MLLSNIKHFYRLLLEYVLCMKINLKKKLNLKIIKYNKMSIFKSYLDQDYEKIKQQLLNSGKLFEGFLFIY